ncbi:MAG: 39S ribosomal protein L45 [Desulfohalobiaceae bacterium]|nr:39S ribosomal protein L45 [Desulfohalobiaceae bacterium]
MMLLELLIIGGIIYLLFRFVAGGRRDAPPKQRESRPGGDMDRQAQDFWNHLRSKEPDSSRQSPESGSTAPAGSPGFNQEEFLQGAKAVYLRVQEAWGKRDLEDIRLFTTERFFRELESRVRQDPKSGATEILLVNARFQESSRQGAEERASVYFDVLLREGGGGPDSKQVREVWTFCREKDNPASHWKLDGIQQADE